MSREQAQILTCVLEAAEIEVECILDSCEETSEGTLELECHTITKNWPTPPSIALTTKAWRKPDAVENTD